MRTDLLIDGKWSSGSDGETISVLDPATGEQVAEVAAGTAADAAAACDAAAFAQKGWAAAAPRVRSEVLRGCWQALVEHTEELAELITPRARKATGRCTRRGHLRGGVLPLERRGGGTNPRLDRNRAGRHQQDRRSPSAGRGRGRHHAVELSRSDDHPQGRPGSCRRQRRGRQSAAGSAADRVTHRRTAE